MARHPGAVYGHSKGAKPGEKHYYRPIYSGGKWDQYLTYHNKPPLLQVCAGGSMMGVARIDNDPEAPAVNILAEMTELPFSTGAFCSVACDPIYELDYPRRIRLQRELFRVARERVIFKAPCIPRGSGWVLVDTTLIGSHTCANVAVLSVLQRDQIGLLDG